MPVQPSSTLVFGFVILTFALAAGLVAAFRRAETSEMPRPPIWMGIVFRVSVMGYLALTGVLALGGVLIDFTGLPPVGGLIMVCTAITVGLAASKIGLRIALGLPVGLLVGFQGFRIIVEWMLHRAYLEGLIPVQMTFEGYNFDILSGLTAVCVGTLAVMDKAPKALLWAWNVLGLGLLTTIVTISILSMPTSLRAFPQDPPNVWIGYFPWVWLPTVLVQGALFGHIVLTRRLLRSTSS